MVLENAERFIWDLQVHSDRIDIFAIFFWISFTETLVLIQPKDSVL